MTLEQYNYYTKKAGIAEGIAQQKAEDEKIIFEERKRSSQKDAEIERLLAENKKLKQQISR